MKLINLRSVYYIAKKEFLDNVRNRWVLLLSAIFIILIFIFSYLSGAQAGGDDVFGDIQNTVFGLVGISSLLIPLIAIILGFSTISGEAESGALYVVLSYPIKRVEVLMGKILGLGLVITLSILLGFGIGGIVIATMVGTASMISYLYFILLSIFLGFIYLSLSICISAFCKRRVTSIGGGILVFFWGLIYGSVLLGVLFGQGYSFADFQTGNVPDWFFNSVLLSPGDMHQTAVQLAFGVRSIDTAGFSIAIPDFLSMPMLLLGHFIWLIIPIVLAYIFFKRRDL